ncbi:MAG: hypothetical protein HC810_02350 [Acaryochloridaceae cyanobacterium RL_2_7]|nr:hypothetical protein [Acaryochloridaceae cyanobacterium RL_2_7]
MTWTFTLLPKIGKSGQTLSHLLTQAPGLDLALALILWLPWIVSSVFAGWQGFLATLAGQILAMQLWILGHEQIMHRGSLNEPRIGGYLNNRYGWLRNNAALWVTSMSLPAFLFIRIAEVFLYPMLVLLLGFKSYKQSEWVNISRHKVEGLVGHDLIWCLYCDWMTGVYSLGAEMLRNVESFWCPIRFYHDKKCENCQIDFPDINGGWVNAEGSMTEVVQTLDQQMNKSRIWSWFGDSSKEEQHEKGSHEKG